MRPPFQLYAPTEADVRKGAVIQRVLKHTLQTTALAENVVEYGPVPGDLVLVLTSFAISAATAGVTTVNNLKLSIRDTALNVLYFVNITPPPTLSEEFNSFDAEILLMPGEQVRMAATYSAGAVGNILETSLHGYLIPRGDLQHGGLPG